MSASILVNRGETIEFSGVWRDDSGAAMNLTGFSIEVSESEPLAIKQHAVVAISAPADGVFTFSMAALHAAALKIGRSVFRLALTAPNGTIDATPEIPIEMK